MLHIYYGFGRGKTSTLNGTILRMLSANISIEYFRFLKGVKTGEDPQLKKLGIEVQNFHETDKFTKDMTQEEKERTRVTVLGGLAKIKKSKANAILIDEFLDLVETKHATESEMWDAIKNHVKEGKDVLISGHYRLEKFFSNADLITEFKQEKHYFNKGIKAKKGIEF